MYNCYLFFAFHIPFCFSVLFFLPGLFFAQPLTPKNEASLKFIEKFNQGKNYFILNETRLALPLFQELYNQQPFNSNINYLLGICYTEEEPLSGKSIFHLEKAVKDVSTDYDASSFSEKRTPVFVYYYLTIAYSQNGRCENAKKAKNYFHTLYGIEKHDYYIFDAERWVKKCKEYEVENNSTGAAKPDSDSVKDIITKNIDYTTNVPLYGIQVGAFSRFVPVYEFKGLKNVEAFIDSKGMVRYVIGNFVLKQQAETLLKTVQEAGYKDAFLVDVNKEKKFSEELVIVNNVSIVNNNIKKVNFKVQIGAFHESIPQQIAKIYLELDGIEEKIENNFTILSIGNFSTYEDAERYKNKIVALGIPDAFIVAFSENKKIDVTLARNFYKK